MSLFTKQKTIFKVQIDLYIIVYDDRDHIHYVVNVPSSVKFLCFNTFTFFFKIFYSKLASPWIKMATCKSNF